ncbi:hypothetical protein [Meiothermus phage MMP17]|nr:hypothetical protein [Meiothermus phage MMP17]
MRALTSKLLPHAAQGLALRIDGDTIYASGFREDVDLETLKKEVTDNWLEMARQEALLLVRDGKEEKAKQLKPVDFDNLLAKLQLGRIKPDEQQRLNDYYDALDELEREAKALLQKLEKAKSVEELNKIPWPEWVGWQALPLRSKLEVEQTYPEVSNK